MQITGFQPFQIEVAPDITIAGAIGGSGPPLLLLHGYPQTHLMWHKIAPTLATEFTVVAADLRGYGASSKPQTDAEHRPYSKRVMAADHVAVMTHFGFTRFALVGHDRGARVAHRLTLDHPSAVRCLAVLDIAPTHAMYREANMAFAEAYYHWFFLIQPADLPERLIGHDPDYWLEKKLAQWGRDPSAFPDAVVAAYKTAFRNPATIHATCEDYRASARIDLAHDEADLQTKIACPLLALWGSKGFIGKHYDVLAEWRRRAADVSGQSVPSGHFLPEEAPAETLAALLPFLRSHTQQT